MVDSSARSLPTPSPCFVDVRAGGSGGSWRVRAQASIVEGGLRLGPQVVPESETSLIHPRDGLQDPYVAVDRRRRGLCPCARRDDREDLDLPVFLRFSDLLGARVLPGRGGAGESVFLVHCPRGDAPRGDGRGGGRVRADMVLEFAGNDGAAADPEGGRAELWASAICARCQAASRDRHLLVFINPTSGSGRAPQDWAVVEDLWRSVPGLKLTAITTSRAQEAFEYVVANDLRPFDGIVICSGDGLVYEVWNGLASRPDAEQALRIPIGHIPSGSGNGLAKSILYASGEHYGVLDAAFAIAKGGAVEKSLMSIHVGDRPRCVSFLSLSAATISDIDISSECLRFIGPARFTVWALGRVVRPVRMQAELAFWPADADEAFPAEEPLLHADLPGNSWQHVEDSFAVFWACQTAWASYDAHCAPGAKLDGGIWHVVLMRGNTATRPALVKALLGFEHGGHVDVPGVEMVRCRAFRLTPRRGGGIFSLDGEVVPFAPLQAWPARHRGFVLGVTSAAEVLPTQV